MERKLCAFDSKYWLEHWAWTRDQADQSNPVKRYPSPAEKPHCYYLVDLWKRYARLILPKSRRLVGTWTFCELWSWDAGFHEGRHNFIQAEKDDKTGELIDRVEFIAEKCLLEPGFISGFKRKREPHEVFFPDTGSKVTGVPMGSDQLRQFAASNILYDEAAFQAELRASLQAASATGLSGGKVLNRIVLLTTANTGSHCQKLVHGNADEEEVGVAA